MYKKNTKIFLKKKSKTENRHYKKKRCDIEMFEKTPVAANLCWFFVSTLSYSYHTFDAMPFACMGANVCACPCM